MKELLESSLYLLHIVQIDLQSCSGVTEQSPARVRLIEFVLLEDEPGAAFGTLVNIDLAVDHRILDQRLEPANENVLIFGWTRLESRRR